MKITVLQHRSRRRSARTGAFLALILLAGIPARSALIDPGRTRLLTTTDPPQLRLCFEVGRTSPARLDVALLNASGKEILKRHLDHPQSGLEIDLPELNGLGPDQRQELPVWRFVFSSPEEDSRQESTSETLGVADVAPDAIGLRLNLLPLPKGNIFEVVIEIFQLSWGESREGIDLRYELLNEEDELLSSGELTTGPRGRAFARISTDHFAEHEEGRVRLVARSGAFVAEESLPCWKRRQYSGSLATDCRLYKPGETVYFRLVVMEPGKGPAADAQVEWHLSSPDGTELFSAEARTSTMGIAHGRWSLPAGSRQGEYELEANVEGRDLALDRSTFFDVQPFQLPTTPLRVETTRPFLLPGEDAGVRALMTTMDGAPLPAALVEIHDRPGDWDPWAGEGDEFREEARATGLTNEQGIALLQFDPWSDDLKQDDDIPEWFRYEDRDFMVSARDPLTGKEVRAPLEIRLSREAVHIYILDDQPNHPDLPIELGVSTYRADGLPMECEVQLKALDDDDRPIGGIGAIHTDASGLGYGRFPPPHETWRKLNEVQLRFEAKCTDGLKAVQDTWIYLPPRRVLRMTPEQPILFPGEAVRLELENSGAEITGILWVMVDKEVLARRFLALKHGSMEIELPSVPRFSGEVEFSLFPFEDRRSEYGARCAVLYTGGKISGDIRQTCIRRFLFLGSR